MNSKIHLVISAFLCTLMSGCVSIQNVDTQKSLKLKSNQGIAVIGLDQGANGLFYMGNFSDGYFTPDGFFPKGISLISGEPYIVQPATATSDKRRYGMESINIGNDLFGFACGEELPVLSLNAGAIQYFGDFALTKKNGKLIVQHSFNIAKAQEYLNKRYPDKHWLLENGEIIKSKKNACAVPSGLPMIIYIRI